MDGSFLRDNLGNESAPFRGVDIHPGAEVVIWTSPGGMFAPGGHIVEDDETLFWHVPAGQLRVEPGTIAVRMMGGFFFFADYPRFASDHSIVSLLKLTRQPPLPALPVLSAAGCQTLSLVGADGEVVTTTNLQPLSGELESDPEEGENYLAVESKEEQMERDNYLDVGNEYAEEVEERDNYLDVESTTASPEKIPEVEYANPQDALKGDYAVVGADRGLEEYATPNPPLPEYDNGDFHEAEEVVYAEAREPHQMRRSDAPAEVQRQYHDTEDAGFGFNPVAATNPFHPANADPQEDLYSDGEPEQPTYAVVNKSPAAEPPALPARGYDPDAFNEESHVDSKPLPSLKAVFGLPSSPEKEESAEVIAPVPKPRGPAHDKELVPVTVRKAIGDSIGIEIYGGVETGNSGIYVSEVTPFSPSDGKLMPHDEIVTIGSQEFRQLSRSEAKDVLLETNGQATIELLVSRKKGTKPQKPSENPKGDIRGTKDVGRGLFVLDKPLRKRRESEKLSAMTTDANPHAEENRFATKADPGQYEA